MSNSIIQQTSTKSSCGILVKKKNCMSHNDYVLCINYGMILQTCNQLSLSVPKYNIQQTLLYLESFSFDYYSTKRKVSLSFVHYIGEVENTRHRLHVITTICIFSQVSIFSF